MHFYGSLPKSSLCALDSAWKGGLRSVAALTRLESPDKNRRTLAVVCSGRIRSDDDDGSSASKFLSWTKLVRRDNQFAL